MSNRFDGARGAWRDVSRRLGARHRVGLPVRWRPEVGATRRRRRRPVPDELREGVLHDLSISGARLLVPAGYDIARDSTFDLEIDACWSKIVVAWVEPSTDPAAVWCGVEFVTPDEAFLAAVYANLPESRRRGG